MGSGKLNKLGLAFIVIHSIIVISIAFLDSLNSSRGFGLVAILGLDIPASFIIMPLANFIGKNTVSPFISISILALIFGGLQWYCIGLVISKLRHKFFPPKCERPLALKNRLERES